MKVFNYFIIAVLFCVAASMTFAQSETETKSETKSKFHSARAIVPVERPSTQPQSFYVNVSVDHKNHFYEEGDKMTVTVKSSKPGYLYLFYKDASGAVTVLFPNRFHSNNYIEAKKKITIPNVAMSFELQTTAPFGTETLQAIVSLQELDLKSLDNPQGNNLFKILDSQQVDSLKNEFARSLEGRRGMGIIPKDFDVADFTLEIKTAKKGHVSKPEKRRIFIGICVAKYIDSPRIPALPACEKDIEEMEKFFKANADNTLILINEDVTKEKIFDLFYNYLPAHTNPGDEIIIYWTGHGARCSDMSGDEEDGYDETLILYDSKAHEPETQLIDDDFGRWAQNLSGRKVLFLMDTCHSEGMANNAKGLVANVNWSPDYEWDFGLGECGLVKDLGQPNLAVIASCSQDQVSLIRKGEDMSVMTWCMIECLKENPPINQKQLYEKIKNPVSDYVKEVYGIRQNVGIQDAFESPMILNPQKLNPQK